MSHLRAIDTVPESRDKDGTELPDKYRLHRDNAKQGQRFRQEQFLANAAANPHLSIKELCPLIPISRRTYEVWRQHNPEFKERMDALNR